MAPTCLRSNLMKSCSGGLLSSSTVRNYESNDKADMLIGQTIIFKERPLVIQKKIAQGSFSKIYKASIANSSPGFALKLLPQKNSHEKKLLFKEVQVIRSIAKKSTYRRFFPRFISIASINQYKCIIMERMNASLRFIMGNSRRKQFKLKDIRCISEQILSGVSYLHNMQIIHTNLKPENIMVTDIRCSPLHIKITGFGHAVTRSYALTATGCSLQTLSYRSPEILFGLPFCDSIDIWSVGCILTEMYIGTRLYPGKTEFQMIEFITQAQGFPAHLDKSSHGSRYVLPMAPIENNQGKSIKMYRLKNEEELIQSEIPIVKDERLNPIRNLADIISRGYNEIFEHKKRESDVLFCSLVRRLLELSSLKRITAKDATEDPFIKKIESDYKIIPTVEL